MRFHSLFILAVSLFLSFSLHAKEIQTGAKVCSNPSLPCKSTVYEFKDHELSFPLPAQLEWQSGHYSADFYAVILRSMKAIPVKDIHGDEVCKGFVEESERLAVQAKFPENKVFTSRNGCYLGGVYYGNVNNDYNFIAVYAGDNKAEAAAILAQAKAAGFADASLRKMQVIVDSGD
jgi:hypothetical protein